MIDTWIVVESLIANDPIISLCFSGFIIAEILDNVLARILKDDAVVIMDELVEE